MRIAAEQDLMQNALHLEPTEPSASATRLARLPVFFDLEGTRVLVAGGNAAAAWKAELLLRTGAQVDLVAESLGEEALALARRAPALRLIARGWTTDDFTDARLAIGGFDAPAAAREFQRAARRAGVPVNMIDRPEFCDFEFGAIIDRSPLVIGISTAGAAPVLAQALRGRLEALLPQAIPAWAAAASRWRSKVQNRNLSPQGKRRFWELFASRALTPSAPAPQDAELARLLDESEQAPVARQGSVALVGAGPGDPELMTLKALRVLQSADVVLFDDLVSPAIVDMARREAEKIAVGKRGYRPSCKQDDIIARMVDLARQGKRVIRLKGGDPMVFGRAHEEIAAMRAAGIPVEVVPGITAALGASASLQLPLTERDRARRVQFITAHGRDGHLPEDIDWQALCDPRASSIVYMGIKTLAALSQRLLANGIEPATPALLIERATCLDERRIAGTIESLPGLVAAAKPTGPCLVMIGAAFELAPTKPEETADEPAAIAAEQSS